jgi:cellulose synthase/poly-beta-1,6-N-acetylglucosamine synthase-like glycosyltransferase
MADWAFWFAVAAVLYAYLGYPLLLSVIVRVRTPRPTAALPGDDDLPGVTMIVPVHDERTVIEPKLTNTRGLVYPSGQLRVVFVSDGSTDGTASTIRSRLDDRTTLMELPERVGKAAALNAALAEITDPIVVFSDASIMLEPVALKAIVRPFADPSVGCVSGEDRIGGVGGEGLYGRYELSLRRKESQLASIVGASGCFYAQRRTLCEPFTPGLAPDFLSVLRTVERGYRAISEPAAVGYMDALPDVSDEFRRKVRTILRGLTTLRDYAHLLNPFRAGVFAFELWSHKVARWLVPFFLMIILATSAQLAVQSDFYRVIFLLQVVLYALGLTAARMPHGRIGTWIITKVAVYFATVNVATLWAWVKYFAGTRQELWQPSRR